MSSRERPVRTCTGRHDPDSVRPEQRLRVCSEVGTMVGMALIAHFRTTFAFDAWANRRLLEVFADLPLQHEILSTWSHLLLAQKLWLARINDEAYDRLTLWTVVSVPESAALVSELERRWNHLLENLTDRDLEREVTFTNTQGRQQSDHLGEILTHVTHHAAHHRGQLTVRMSAAGFNPPTTDVISFSRAQRDR